ncbi:MAG: elongation factor G [Oscillospiraceae bacterium]|nr:elongation factor G [Oscillospiraceae bacterium]
MEIRNVCLMGHGGEGKTSLAESMLFLTGGADRLGKVTDGNTVCDFDPEEIRRKISISATPVPVRLGTGKINVIDTPGYFDFTGEVLQALRVAETGIITAGAKSGLSVGTEKAWKLCKNKPKMIYISKIDEENSDFSSTFSTLRDALGISVCPVVIPATDGDRVESVVDIVSGKAYKSSGGKVDEIPLSDEMKVKIDEALSVLSENVAETDEALMEKFFEGEPFTKEELIKGIRAGVAAGSLCPVFCGSAVTGLGTELLLQGIMDYAPAPGEAGQELDASGKELKASPDGDTALFVYKTLIDQYGKFSFFKVVSGSLAADTVLTNSRTGGSEKISNLFVTQGKDRQSVREFAFGDIGAVSKLSDTSTGDTLCAGNAGALRGIDFPEPCYSLAFSPKQKGGEEKISQGLGRMGEEDLTFILKNDAETHQLVVSGQGDIQLDILCSRLKSKFGVEVETEAPRVAYREKIRKKVTGIEGKHKKQSGGSGQFGVVYMTFEPNDESEELVFEETVVGGSVPKNFYPAVEKGLRGCVSHGVLAGYPMVFLKATLTDGKYHPVDSNEVAFKTAASLAYKAGLPQASPVILEPLGALKVSIPDQYMGDIMGDISKRRGRVMGMNPIEDGWQVVDAEVPMAEMSAYAIDLRSMTQGRGSFTVKFERYEETPGDIQQRVIEEAKAMAEE